jgi:hypothetical protein
MMLRMDSTAAKKTRKRNAAAKRPQLPTLSGAELSAYLLAFTSTAASAVSVAQACKHAKSAGHTVRDTEVAAAYEQWVDAGRLFRHPSAARAAKFKHAYWPDSPTTFVRQRLQRALGTHTQITLSKLQASSPREYRRVVDATIASLLQEGALFEKPGSAKSKTYTTQPLPPTALLTAAQRKSLQGLLDKINGLRHPPIAMIELLQFLDGAARPSVATLPTLAQLEELYRLDLPTRGGLSSMPIPMTWRRYAQLHAGQGAGANRAAFEQLLLDGAAAGRVELIAHEWPATLAADDLTAAIRQSSGRVLYYWRPLQQATVSRSDG